jgi:hypothetical protein
VLRWLTATGTASVLLLTGLPADAGQTSETASPENSPSNRVAQVIAQVDRALEAHDAAQAAAEDPAEPAPEPDGETPSQEPPDEGPAGIPEAGEPAPPGRPRVQVPADGSGTVEISAGPDAVRLELPAPAEQSLAQQMGADALFDAGQSAQLVRPTAEGVRVFTLMESAAAPSRLSYGLQLPSGWTLTEAAGGFEITDVTGAVRFLIDAPWARDALGAPVPASYEVADGVLTLIVDHAGAAYPVVADPFLRIYDEHARQRLQLKDASVWSRGYIASSCLLADVACESEKGKFRAECTAQSKALRSLARYNNSLGWMPADRIVDASRSPIDEWVQWEVGRYKGKKDGECEFGETGRSWRVDIVVRPFSVDDDLVNILEVKEWRGPDTRRGVRTQLSGYLDEFEKLQRSGGPRAVPERRLTNAGWAWCYQNDGRTLLGNRREYCAWADLPGHIYFAPVDKLSSTRLRELRDRFARTQEAERNADGSLEEDPVDGGGDVDQGWTEAQCLARGYWWTEPDLCEGVG